MWVSWKVSLLCSTELLKFAVTEKVISIRKARKGVALILINLGLRAKYMFSYDCDQGRNQVVFSVWV